jgi:hypothetical protein
MVAMITGALVLTLTGKTRQPFSYFVGSTMRPMNRMLPLPFSRIRKMNG